VTSCNPRQSGSIQPDIPCLAVASQPSSLADMRTS